MGQSEEEEKERENIWLYFSPLSLAQVFKSCSLDVATMFARYLQGQIGKHSSLTAIFACQQVMQGSPQLQFALFHCPLHFAPLIYWATLMSYDVCCGYYSFTHLVSQISSIFLLFYHILLGWHRGADHCYLTTSSRCQPACCGYTLYVELACPPCGCVGRLWVPTVQILLVRLTGDSKQYDITGSSNKHKNNRRHVI